MAHAICVQTTMPVPDRHAIAGMYASTSAGPRVNASAMIHASSSAVPPGARRFHLLERALAQERLVVALREHGEEPLIEFLVDPEVARPARLVREPAGGEHGDALVVRIGLQHLAQRDADLVRARRAAGIGGTVQFIEIGTSGIALYGFR